MPPTKRATKKKAPTAEPKAPPERQDFVVDDDHTIRWDLGGTVYVLRPLTFGAYIELDRERRFGAQRILGKTLEAMELPANTAAEAEAKLQATEDAASMDTEWAVGWYELLFKHAAGEAFPRDVAPGWIIRPNVMMKILDVLQGPPPPGVG